MLKIGIETLKYPWNEGLFVLWIVLKGVTVPPVTQKSRLNLNNRTALVIHQLIINFAAIPDWPKPSRV